MYEVSIIEAGFLKTEPIKVVHMPRKKFMEIVTATLDKGWEGYDEDSGELIDSSYDSIRDEIIAVAETMVRFPLSEWLDVTRGCGCVVGEYLVANSELDRAAVVERYSHTSIEAMLRDNPYYDDLIAFGNDIDAELYNHLDEGGYEGVQSHFQIDAIEITDEAA